MPCLPSRRHFCSERSTSSKPRQRASEPRLPHAPIRVSMTPSSSSSRSSNFWGSRRPCSSLWNTRVHGTGRGLENRVAIGCRCPSPPSRRSSTQGADPAAKPTRRATGSSAFVATPTMARSRPRVLATATHRRTAPSAAWAVVVGAESPTDTSTLATRPPMPAPRGGKRGPVPIPGDPFLRALPDCHGAPRPSNPTPTLGWSWVLLASSVTRRSSRHGWVHWRGCRAQPAPAEGRPARMNARGARTTNAPPRSENHPLLPRWRPRRRPRRGLHPIDTAVHMAREGHEAASGAGVPLQMASQAGCRQVLRGAAESAPQIAEPGSVHRHVQQVGGGQLNRIPVPNQPSQCVEPHRAPDPPAQQLVRVVGKVAP
eukprot:scaffold3205_cov688-Prasinococcus_capsulatus_cf.AAC.5